MIVNTLELLNKNKVLYQFNTSNLELTKFILEECQNLNHDVILGVSEGTLKYMGGAVVVSSLVKSLIKSLNIKINVALHLDHSLSFDICKEAIDNGFSSVMIDASSLPLEENILLTKKVVDYAHQFNVSVEGEVGIVPYNKDNLVPDMYGVNDYVKYLNETGVDLLAPAIGNIHGLYKNKALIDFEFLKELSKTVDVPLVVHGGSGVSTDDIVKLIKLNVRKININTNLQFCWKEAIKLYIANNENIVDTRKILKSGEATIKESIKEYFEIIKNI